MAKLSILVKHERHDHRATEVEIEGDLSEGIPALVERARAKLRSEDYERYRFVTEHPLPPLHAPQPVGSNGRPYFDDDYHGW